MERKVYLHVQKGSEEDIREALDDILSSGLIGKIADEKGNEVLLEVVTAGEAPAPAPKAAAKKPEPVRKMELAKKTSEENGIARETAMVRAARGEDETCLGQRVTLTDRGGGAEELARQRLKALWEMNQARVFMMELPGMAVLEGTDSPWYPLGSGQEGEA